MKFENSKLDKKLDKEMSKKSSFSKVLKRELYDRDSKAEGRFATKADRKKDSYLSADSKVYKK